MLRLLADENLDFDIVRGVLRRRPGIDIVRVARSARRRAHDLKRFTAEAIGARSHEVYSHAFRR